VVTRVQHRCAFQAEGIPSCSDRKKVFLRRPKTPKLATNGFLGYSRESKADCPKEKRGAILMVIWGRQVTGQTKRRDKHP
jgi:hypothetical protein